MKYEADVIYLLNKGRTEGEAVGIERGIENERYRTLRIFELAKKRKSIDDIAADINMPREYVEETLNAATAIMK